jgi:hypothetical protein
MISDSWSIDEAAAAVVEIEGPSVSLSKALRTVQKWRRQNADIEEKLVDLASRRDREGT